MSLRQPFAPASIPSIVLVLLLFLFGSASAAPGHTYVWGRNLMGYFGNGKSDIPIMPTPITNTSWVSATWSKIQSGWVDSGSPSYNAILMLTSAGDVYRMAYRSTSSSYAAAPTSEALGYAFKDVMVGLWAFYGIDAAGAVYCWGQDNYGECGLGSSVAAGTAANYATPTKITLGGVGAKNITKIAAGPQFVVLMASDGALFSFGRNDAGQLGQGGSDSNRHSTPVTITLPNSKVAADVSCGWEHCVVLTTDGLIYAWGVNNNYQINMDYVTPSSSYTCCFGVIYATPRLMDTTAFGGLGVLRVAATFSSTVAILSSGEVRCHARNNFGECGIGSIDVGPWGWIQPNFTAPAASIPAPNSARTFVRLTNGTFVAWGRSWENGGRNWDYPVGDGNMMNQLLTPALLTSDKFENGEQFTHVAVGFALGVFLSNRNRIFVMGSGVNTMQIIPTTTNYTPTRFNKTGTLLWGYGVKQVVGSEDTYNAIEPKCGYTVLLRDDGAVLTSGCNVYGSLGTGNVVSRDTFGFTDPNGPLFGQTVVSIASASYAAYAVRSDGKAYGWGLKGWKSQLTGAISPSNLITTPTILNITGYFIVKVYAYASTGGFYNGNTGRAVTIFLTSNGGVLGWGGQHVYNFIKSYPDDTAVVGSAQPVGTGAIDIALGEGHASVVTNTSQWYAGGPAIYANQDYQLSPTTLSGVNPWTLLSATSSRIQLIAASVVGTALVRNDTQLLVRGCATTSSKSVCLGGTTAGVATRVVTPLAPNTTWISLQCTFRTCHAQDSSLKWWGWGEGYLAGIQYNIFGTDLSPNISMPTELDWGTLAPTKIWYMTVTGTAGSTNFPWFFVQSAAKITSAPTFVFTTATQFDYVLDGAGFASDDVITPSTGAILSKTFVNGNRWLISIVPPFNLGPLGLRFNQDGVDTANLTIATVYPPTTLTPSTQQFGENSTTLMVIGMTLTAPNVSLLRFSFSSGSCSNFIVETTQIKCIQLINMALGPLYLTITGGSANHTSQVATIVPAPKFATSLVKQSVLVTSIVLAGTDFGSNDGNLQLFFLPGGNGNIQSVNATHIVVAFFAQPAVGLLSVYGIRSGGQGPTSVVATIVAAHTITETTNAISITDTSIVIGGTGFSTSPTEMSVLLSPQGTCTVVSSTSTSLTCSSVSGIVPGGLSAYVTYAGATVGPTNVAVVTTLLSIVNSTAELADTASQLRISGSGFFSSPAPNVSLSTGACLIVSVSTNELLCNVSGLFGYAGQLSATIRQGGQVLNSVLATVVPTASLDLSLDELAVNANEFVLAGSNLGNDSSAITLTLSSGAASCVSASPNAITCRFSQPPALGQLRAAVTRAGASSSSIAVRIIVGSSSIYSSLQWISVASSQLSLTGVFRTTDPSKVAITLSSGTCAVVTVNAAVITCSVSNVQVGNLTATVAHAGGVSAEVIVARIVGVASLSPSNRLLSQAAPQLGLQGSGIVSDADLFVTLSSGTCTLISSTSTSISCVLGGSLQLGTLTAAVTQGGISSQSVAVANVIGQASLTSRPDNKLAIGAPFLQIGGSNFVPSPNSGQNQVTLTPFGSCSPTNSTTTSITCSVSNLRVGTLYAEVVSAGGLSARKKRAPVAVAQVLPLPSISNSSEPLNLDSSQLVINGADFATPATDHVVSLIINDDFSNPIPCAVNASESAPPTKLICNINSTFSSFPFGVVKVQIALYGATTSPTVVGILLLPAPVRELVPFEAAPTAIIVNTVSEGLSPGSQAGIAIGIIVALILVVVAIVLFIRYRLTKKRDIDMGVVEAPPPEYASMLSIQSNELTIDKKLGEGSFGAVYLGTYKGEKVAIKKLSNAVSGGGQLNEFFRESALMLSLKPHENVLKPIGMCQEVKNYALVMELVEKGSLDHFLRRPPIDITEELQVRLIKGIAAGMAALAAQNIVHRDLAARNILLGKNYTPKVSDFGFSRKVGDEKEGKTYNAMGPVRWMSPEAIGKNVYSEKSDVWAFGVTVWEILSKGKQPHANVQLIDLAVQIRDEGLTLTVPPGTPKALKKLLHRCWEYEAYERPTFTDICEMLETSFPTLSGEGDDAAKSASKSRRGASFAASESKAKQNDSKLEMVALPVKTKGSKEKKPKETPKRAQAENNHEYTAISVTDERSVYSSVPAIGKDQVDASLAQSADSSDSSDESKSPTASSKCEDESESSPSNTDLSKMEASTSN